MFRWHFDLNLRRKWLHRKRDVKITFPAAFLYRRVASWIRSRTSSSPLPHGTTTRTLPKQTVTFMATEFFGSLSWSYRSVLNKNIRYLLSKRVSVESVPQSLWMQNASWTSAIIYYKNKLVKLNFVDDDASTQCDYYFYFFFFFFEFCQC